jgi:hypothetical protein
MFAVLWRTTVTINIVSIAVSPGCQHPDVRKSLNWYHCSSHVSLVCLLGSAHR